MISVITSVHNQKDMNILFYETLKKNTKVEYELIIIDNNSTDGSREFFQEKTGKVILNSANYSYPYCQNQGIKIAKYEYLAFLNNDILVSKNWDTRSLEIMNNKNIDIVSFMTNDTLENKQISRRISRKWKRIKYPFMLLFGPKYFNLKLMAYLMYGNFNRFTEKRYATYKDLTIEGISGPCIMMKKSVMNKIGLWDERIQAADFDIFNRTKIRAIQQKDIKPVQLLPGVYIHHYQRLTVKSGFIGFADKQNHIKLEEKWGNQLYELRKDIV